jgi:NADH-quinone oxidoreductase subunit C
VIVEDGQKVSGLLSDKFPQGVVSTGSFRDQYWVEVTADALVEICTWLQADPTTDFSYLVDVTAVHWPHDPKPMELVYHLHSLKRNDRLRIKLRTGVDEPVPTLCAIWESANWNEREIFDMFGIEFTGHPDLRRILMPDDYSDFPLRKEFPLYRG